VPNSLRYQIVPPVARVRSIEALADTVTRVENVEWIECDWP
jgi:hypothetical protein